MNRGVEFLALFLATVTFIFSFITIRNLHKDIDWYKAEIDNYLKTDKTFIVVKYLQGRDLKAEIETLKIAPKETIHIIQKPDVDLVGVNIVREN